MLEAKRIGRFCSEACGRDAARACNIPPPIPGRRLRKSLPRGLQHVKEHALTSALYHTFVVSHVFFTFFCNASVTAGRGRVGAASRPYLP